MLLDKGEDAKVDFNPFLAPNKDLGFYFEDELTFKVGVYCRTLLLNYRMADDYIREYGKISCPVFVAQAALDSCVCNKAMDEFFEAIGSKEKVKAVYDDEHLILYNGLMYEQVVTDELKWLDSLDL